MKSSGQECLARARRGDAEAFAELFESLRPSVFAVAVRLVGPDEADDVVMDTFLRAWQSLGGFGGRASLKSWLYRIACNCAIDAIRRRRRRREVWPGREGEETRTDVVEDRADEQAVQPSGALEREETCERVDRALRRLPEEHRVALLLRYSDGLSYREIAAATGVPIGTVMSRLFNGKRKLKEAWLEEAGPEGGGR